MTLLAVVFGFVSDVSCTFNERISLAGMWAMGYPDALAGTGLQNSRVSLGPPAGSTCQ